MARLESTDIVRMRRSLAMAPTLPADQVLWLLDELEVMVEQQTAVRQVLARLREPFHQVRLGLIRINTLR